MALAAPSLAGCGDARQGYTGPWIDAEDFTLRTPQLYVPPAEGAEQRPRAHPVNNTVGWAYLTSYETAAQVNTWSRRNIERLTPLVDQARAGAGQALEDGAMSWGPFDDPEGRALQWRVVEPATTDARLALEVRGEASEPWQSYLSVAPGEPGSDGERSGTLRIEAGLSADLPELGYHLYDTIRDFEGAFELEFLRAEGGHTISVRWEDFAAIDTGLVDGSFRAQEVLHYIRAAEGDGLLRFDRIGVYEDLGFTGPALDRMLVELHWAADQSGSARLSILATDDWFPGGDPSAGTLWIEECFDAQGKLTWRDIAAPYLQIIADYQVGDVEACGPLGPP